MFYIILFCYSIGTKTVKVIIFKRTNPEKQDKLLTHSDKFKQRQLNVFSNIFRTITQPFKAFLHLCTIYKPFVIIHQYFFTSLNLFNSTALLKIGKYKIRADPKNNKFPSVVLKTFFSLLVAINCWSPNVASVSLIMDVCAARLLNYVSSF